MQCPLKADCTGCPACNSVYRALVSAPPREQQQFAALKEAANRQRATPTTPTALSNNPPSPAALHAAAVKSAGMVTTLDPPEPASLVGSIRERAGLPPLEAAPVHKIDLRFTPEAPTALHGVDNPPSLIDAIQQKGAR
jgi:hypothetical protein